MHACMVKVHAHDARIDDDGAATPTYWGWGSIIAKSHFDLVGQLELRTDF